MIARSSVGRKVSYQALPSGNKIANVRGLYCVLKTSADLPEIVAGVCKPASAMTMISFAPSLRAQDQMGSFQSYIRFACGSLPSTSGLCASYHHLHYASVFCETYIQNTVSNHLRIANHSKRLVRFLAKDGRTYYGDAILPQGVSDIGKTKQAHIIKGDIFGKHDVTEQIAVSTYFIGTPSARGAKVVRMSDSFSPLSRVRMPRPFAASA